MPLMELNIYIFYQEDLKVALNKTTNVARVSSFSDNACNPFRQSKRKNCNIPGHFGASILSGADETQSDTAIS